MTGIFQIEDITGKFKDEFGILARRFDVHNIPLAKAKDWPGEVAKPGVYVFWTPQEGVIRVGKSFDNSRKRALTHISNNTGGMASLGSNSDARLFLFNPNNGKDLHWIAGLEVFFEENLHPTVPAKRIG
jgi:hypothetical protein